MLTSVYAQVFVMLAITRETIYLINLRQAYLLSPWNASRLSSRTVLLTVIYRLSFPLYGHVIH